ncbi:MAG: hypothetical protein GX922_07455 [Firmicutes bacterium]|nr:hypothetical protein [Bacillota bacterium]
MKFKILLSVLLINLVLVSSVSAAELPYTYEQLSSDIIAVSQLANVETFSIGQSEYGREIYAIKIGKGELSTIIIGTAHAREWINSALIMDMAKLYADVYNNYGYEGNYYVRDVLDKCSIVFIPMQNPDGAALQEQGLSAFTPEQQEEIKKIGCDHKFKQWKANAKGVDLNHQYNAGWEQVRNNQPYPSYHNHKGYAPEQASEVKATVEYIRSKPDSIKALISYHSSGNVIYWTSLNPDIDRDARFAQKIRNATGYFLINNDWIPNAGLSPWFRKEIGGMALTIETGTFNGENEVRYSDWPKIWNQNKMVGLITASEVYQNWFNSEERQIKIDELSGNINQYKQEIHDIDKALDDIRHLKQINGDNELTIIIDNKIIELNNPLIAKNGLSYISCKDLSKLIEINETPSRSRTYSNEIFENGQIYIPIRQMADTYEIQWANDSKTVLLYSKLQTDETSSEED